MEIEADGEHVDDGGRIVFTNANRQKVVEIGLSNKEMIRIFGEEKYNEMREYTRRLAKGNENRGTAEYLVSDKIYASEWNGREQVENKGRALLYEDLFGNPVNTTAEKLCRAFGHPVPTSEDRVEKHGCVVHIRLVPATWNTKASQFDFSEPYITGFNAPDVPWATVSLLTGKVDIGGDPKIGVALISGNTREEAYERAAVYLEQFSLNGLGDNSYYKKLAALLRHAPFVKATVGTNDTTECLAQLQVSPPSRLQEAIGTIGKVVVPEVLEKGWLPGEPHMIGQLPYPEIEQVERVRAIEEGLRQAPLPDTPFSRLLQNSMITHSDIAEFIGSQRSAIKTQGGAFNFMFRDIGQEGVYNNTSLIWLSMILIAEQCPEIIQFMESGGALIQKAGMLGIDPTVVQGEWVSDRIPTQTLTREECLFSLMKLSPKQIDFVVGVWAKQLRSRWGLEEGSQLPYWINLFDSGNSENKLIPVMRIFLRHGFQVTPNNVVDRAFDNNRIFDRYVKINEAHLQETGRLPDFERCKRKGDGQFTYEEMEAIRQPMRDARRSICPGVDPAIEQDHLHVVDPSTYGREENYRKYLTGKGILWTLDMGIPGLTHMDPRAVVNNLTLTDEQREKFNDVMVQSSETFDLLSRYNTTVQTRRNTPITTQWALGTAGTNPDKAKVYNIPIKDLDGSLQTTINITQFHSAVTPKSEVNAIFCGAAYKVLNEQGIKYTEENLRSYVLDPEYGKRKPKIEVQPDILSKWQEWDVDGIERPPFINKLLTIDGVSLTPPKQPEDTFDPEVERQKLQDEFPDHEILDRHVSTVIQFGKIGRDFLKKKFEGKEITGIASQYELYAGKNVKEGTSFNINGIPITYLSKSELSNGANEYQFDIAGKKMSFVGATPNVAGSGPLVRMADPNNPNHIAAPMVGEIVECLKEGASVGTSPLAKLYAMKMENLVRSNYEQSQVVETFVKPGDKVEVGQLLAIVKPKAQDDLVGGKLTTGSSVPRRSFSTSRGGAHSSTVSRRFVSGIPHASSAVRTFSGLGKVVPGRLKPFALGASAVAATLFGRRR